MSGQGENEFLKEFQTLLEYKHDNIIGIVGYCFEMDETIILCEYPSRGRLDRYLGDSGLTWMKRLQICIDVASGLHYLHGGEGTQQMMVHRDINSYNVLLTHDWKAKLTNFGLSLMTPMNKEIDFVGTVGYYDPLYFKFGFLTQGSDIYSLGIVLFEILCGKLAFDAKFEDMRRFLHELVIHNYKEGKLGEMVFDGIKEQIAPKTLTTFQSLALQCLHEKSEERPTTREVLLRLKQALEYQEDYDIWRPKLSKDYEKLIQLSNSPETYSTENYKDLYQMFSKGILLREGIMLFDFDNVERNVMISAKNFSYKNSCLLHKWQCIPQSRFEVVAEMLDLLNLNIKIKTRNQFLTPNVVYGVYLVFKFCDPIKVSSKPLYVNLKYRNRSKTLHAYFATRRDNDWMMIEMWRFLNDKQDIVSKFLLHSFSLYYCGNSIHIQGIEFRAITNVKYEEISELKKVQQVLKSDKNMDLLQQLPGNHKKTHVRIENEDGGEKLLWLHEVDGKKHFMLSAKAVLNNYRNMKLFKTMPSRHSRFPKVIELLPQEVFCISCTIKSEMLSRDTDYVGYLVFKLSEKCHGLHGPIKVRGLPNWSDEEDGIIYFKYPSPWNLHDNNQAPKQRSDGWMEVKVWKFNFNNEFEDDHFHMNLRLNSYEGTMSGLIVYGIEFRPTK